MEAVFDVHFAIAPLGDCFMCEWMWSGRESKGVLVEGQVGQWNLKKKSWELSWIDFGPMGTGSPSSSILASNHVDTYSTPLWSFYLLLLSMFIKIIWETSRSKQNQFNEARCVWPQMCFFTSQKYGIICSFTGYN